MVIGSDPAPAWRIVVGGGGAAGLVFALALARSLGPAVRLTVADPAFARPGRPHRAYALSPASVSVLEAVGLWRELAPGAQPITAMTITDGRTDDVVRPDYLSFRAGGGPSGALAHMVEAAPLLAALERAAGRVGVELSPVAVGAVVPGRAATDLALGRETVRATLVVAADGGRSRLRDGAGIGVVGRDYPQNGIVGTVRHAGDHGGRAVQHFLPAGPFAVLPLASSGEGFRSSIVWTERAGRVRDLLALPGDALEREVAARVGPEFGTVRIEGALSSLPLSVRLARRYVADRLALLGDAAHQIHPLAGQGLNLGLMDAAALAERVADAVRLGLDPGTPDVLAAYERDRRFDAVRLAALTDGLNRLFSNDVLPLRVLRDLGLGLVDRAGGLKERLLEAAAGTGGRAPRLARGLPL